MTWLPLYLAFLLVGTATPMTLRAPPWPFWNVPQPVDFALNVALFLPFGWYLRRWKPWQAGVCALVLSAGIEWAQRWIFRSPSFWDVAANGVGGLLGHLVPMGALLSLLPSARWLRGSFLVVGAAGAMAAMVALEARLPKLDFSNWEPFPLVIGNELADERPWEGLLREVAVFDRTPEPMSPSAGAIPKTWDAGGPILWMRFAAPSDGRLDGPAGPRPIPGDHGLTPPLGSGCFSSPDGLVVSSGGRWVLPDALARHVYERLGATGRVAIRARVVPDPDPAHEQGRIITLSRSGLVRCFTLGQNAGEAIFRVRTPATGLNGSDPQAWTGNRALARGPVEILATFDPPWSRIYVDGALAAATDLLALKKPRAVTNGLPLSIAIATTLAALGAAILTGGSHLRRAAAMLIAAALVMATIAGLGVGAHAPKPHWLLFAPTLLPLAATLHALRNAGPDDRLL